MMPSLQPYLCIYPATAYPSPPHFSVIFTRLSNQQPFRGLVSLPRSSSKAPISRALTHRGSWPPDHLSRTQTCHLVPSEGNTQPHYFLCTLSGKLASFSFSLTQKIDLGRGQFPLCGAVFFESSTIFHQKSLPPSFTSNPLAHAIIVTNPFGLPEVVV